MLTRFTIATIGLLASMVSGTPVSGNDVVVKRAPNFNLVGFNAGDCTGGADFDASVTPGQCTEFTQANLGAIAITGQEECVLKFWEDSGCTGQAVTWFVAANRLTNYIPVADYNGVFTLGSGARSVIANCATNIA
ncbi:hypothetical protein B0T26DRAFT_681345 [Lasiosphaeria miniovina]|uniref:Uncharacterized protein n=1 Tax=Lasiosphaeria miniovina TaxID=1954250 RepID=A0AA40DHU4_9PEZI|nr:uncharacterized protein B0T26DRAFT_681345 [Lasiosphaeria miniovina]KAK0703700.1 hypothetical protein B0T26DRAFT_681345 [Lasiosphaeria miniovina]